MKSRYSSTLLGFLMALSYIIVIPEIAHATIFKCVNGQGATYYNDKPCPKNNEETELKATKDPKNGYKFSDSEVEKESKEKTAIGASVKKGVEKSTGQTQNKTEDMTLTNKLASDAKTASSNDSSSSESSDTPTAISRTNANAADSTNKKKGGGAVIPMPPSLPR